MAHGQIAAATVIGGTSGVVAGPIGIVAGSVTGYLSASGIFGGHKKKSVTPPVPIYKQPIFLEVVGVGFGILVLVVMVIHKKAG